jgi:hypothetical protein
LLLNAVGFLQMAADAPVPAVLFIVTGAPRARQGERP